MSQIQITNPATETLIKTLEPGCVETAVKSALDCQSLFNDFSGSQRRNLLLNIAVDIEKHSMEYAELACLINKGMFKCR